MNLTTIFVSTTLTTLAMGLGLFLFVARRTRPEIFFAVTVNASFRDSAAAREILRKFNHAAVFWTVLAAIVAALAFLCAPATALIMSCAAELVQLAGTTMALVQARKKTLAHRTEPSSEREAQLTPNDSRPAGGWLGQLGPFLVLAILALVVGIQWPQIPARFPIHWGADGKPNDWANKSWASVFLLPIMGAVVCGLFCALSLSLQRGIRRIHASGAQRAHEDALLRCVLWIFLAVEYFMAVLVGGVAFLPLMISTDPGHDTFPTSIAVILAIAIPSLAVVAIVIIAARSKESGSRSSAGERAGAHAERKPVGDRTPDECWKGGGLFYYNPNDPALWVEKRFGVGYTVNFARCGAWFLLGGVLLFGVLSIMLPRLLLK
jgi:uncharacterized membrane protein